MGNVYEFEKDGKKYVAVEKGIDVFLRWLTWIVSILIIFFLFFNIILYTTHIDEMRMGPIEYGIRESVINSCICESENTQFFIDEGSVTTKNKKDLFDFPNLNISGYLNKD